MTDDLARRLKALRTGEGSKPTASSSKLVLEPKQRPQLVARGSDDPRAETKYSLVDELAAALGDDERQGKSGAEAGDHFEKNPLSTADQGAGADVGVAQARALDREASSLLREASSLTTAGRHDAGDTTSEDAQVDALMARFTALRGMDSERLRAPGPPTKTQAQRPRASPPEDNTTTSQTISIDLPSVPEQTPSLDLPSVPETLPSIPTHPTLGPNHSDISSTLDLSPFRKLVSGDLDVRDLPLSHRVDDDEVEKWCTICTEDATVSCFSPLDEDDGCAGDLYCAKCWVEGHGGMGREELREHRTKEVGGAKGRSDKRGGGGAPGGKKALAA